MSAPNHLIPHFIDRARLDSGWWDACVAASAEPELYAYSWYLDAVLPAPNWKWVGLVLLDDTGQYRAVMPVPLRRKMVAGIPYAWVVHQPLFCQFLGIFSRDGLIDTELFFQQIFNQYRYGSVFCTRQQPNNHSPFGAVYLHSTHILDLSIGYPALFRYYTKDRKANLRRAVKANWTMVESGDLEPLLTLFKENHAQTIDGGVSDRAYSTLRNLANELTKRGLITLRYALHNGRIEAGILLVQEGNRIIYLFNAASEAGRRGNARTLLIDRFIQEKSGQPLRLDFESPAKQAIRDFYRSFGSVECQFWTMRWNRLNPVEKALIRVRNWLTGYSQ